MIKLERKKSGREELSWRKRDGTKVEWEVNKVIYKIKL